MLESDRFFFESRGFNENFSDRIETYNDRHIMAKHSAIYPSEEELQAIQVIVTACEKSLKLISDTLHEEAGTPQKVSVIVMSDVNWELVIASYHFCMTTADRFVTFFKYLAQDSEGKEIRLMKGVMRVGDLAKGLLLSKNLNIELVVLCTEKPTQTLLTKMYSMLPDKMKVHSIWEFSSLETRLYPVQYAMLCYRKFQRVHSTSLSV